MITAEESILLLALPIDDDLCNRLVTKWSFVIQIVRASPQVHVAKPAGILNCFDEQCQSLLVDMNLNSIRRLNDLKGEHLPAPRGCMFPSAFAARSQTFSVRRRPTAESDAGLRTTRAFEIRVALVPSVHLLAFGTGHSVEPDGAIFPSPRVSAEPSGNRAARYRASDHHLKRLGIFVHHRTDKSVSRKDGVWLRLP